MRTFKTASIIICSILLLTLLSSCEKENKPDYEAYLIKVDSVHIPINIAANEPFDLEFFGIVGNNGCFQFSKFETSRLGDEIRVEVWGKFDKNAKVCPAVMVSLEGKKLNQTIEKTGNYTLKVKQPDGSYLVEKILIK